MKKISAIKLSYDNADRVKFQLYAEFFRFLGIYVWEYCTSMECFFGEGKLLADDEDVIYYSVEPDSRNNPEMDFGRQETLLRILRNDVVMVGLDDDFLAAFDVLSEIFAGNNLFTAALTLQYFRYNNEKTKEAGISFEKAASEIDHKIKEKVYVDNRYMIYAKLYCLQKSNLSSVLCNQTLAVLESDLVRQCLSLLKDHPDFSNVWTLIGMIYEKSNGKSRELLAAFENALQMTGDRPFVSSIYYWIGKRYETLKLYDNAMENAYRKAYKCAPKYRVIYKMGIAMERLREWEKAVNYYDECLRFLELKEKYLDLLELEYYFKTHIRAAFILITKQEKFGRGILHIEQALRYREELEETLKTGDGYSEFARQIYGGEYQDFVSLAFERMNPERAYQYLSIAYSRLGVKKKL